MSETIAPFVAASNRPGTGLEYLQRIVSGDYAQLPIGVTLGFRIAAVEPGSVTIRGTPSRSAYNLIDTMHGGWAAAMVDTAIALSSLSLLDASQTFTTLDIRVNFIRPITVDTGEVVAVGNVINGGRRVAYCEAKVTDPQGKLLAHGTGSCLILPR